MATIAELLAFSLDALKQVQRENDFTTTRIEYSYYLMAQDAGMEMMPSMLIEGEKEAHFLTERFDRKGDEKIHIQTLAAMPPHEPFVSHLFFFSLPCNQ